MQFQPVHLQPCALAKLGEPVWVVFDCCLCGGPAGAIPHGSRLKIRMRHPGGWWVDRIPAWIKWATGEAGGGLGHTLNVIVKQTHKERHPHLPTTLTAS
jgi:hypothetical protein